MVMDRRFSLLVAFFLLIAATSFASHDPGDAILIRQADGEDHQLNAEENQFRAFQRKFNKSYASQEELLFRLMIFRDNLRRAERHQKLDPSAVHGVTQFSDMTQEEFRIHLGLRSRLNFPADYAGEEAPILPTGKEAPILPTDNLPHDFDWRDHGAVTGMKNFSVVSRDEDQMAANLVKHGPLVVAVNAVFMQTYVGGVSCPFVCSKRLDHRVLLVGYGYAPIRMNKEKPYWIIKNSWGENWGENGYYKICKGHNACGVHSSVAAIHPH